MALAVLALITACGSDTGRAPVTAGGAGEQPVTGTPLPRKNNGVHHTVVPDEGQNTVMQSPVTTPYSQFEIGNTRYLFVLNEHSMEEMHSLLLRADEIARTSSGEFDELEIAMVIHGPTVNLFRQDNRIHNSEIIELAEKLNTSNVINFKICETSLSREGVNREEIPKFIESVPFAPDEIERLKGNGYLNL